MSKHWYQSKTIWTALAAILAAWAAHFTEGADLSTAIQASVISLLAIFLRKGQGVAIAPLLLMALVLAPGCATDGGRVQPATGTTTTGGYVGAGGAQEATGGTYIAIGGDTYIHPKPGVTVPKEISSAVAKVLESEASVDSKAKFLDAMGKLYGFTVTFTNSRVGAVDQAGTTGKPSIPPVTEPDEDPKKADPDGG